jgi:hypothetical protein
MGSARSLKKQFGHSCKQSAKANTAQADLMSALFAGSFREFTPTSAVSNPAKTSPDSGHEIISGLRNKLKDHISSLNQQLGTDTLVRVAANLTAHGNPANLVTLLLGAKQELASFIPVIGLAKAAGWKLLRAADAYNVMAKYFTAKVEAAIHLIGPLFAVNARTIHQSSRQSVEHTNLKIVLSEEEVHSLASQFCVDAQTVLLLATLNAKLHSSANLELAATAQATLSAGVGLNLLSGADLQMHSNLLTIRDGGGGTITMGGGIINLNPMAPAAPKTPLVVPPILAFAVDATSQMPPDAILSQYRDINAHGSTAT